MNSGAAVWNSRTGLLFSCSELEKAIWEELEEADTKLKALFSFPLPHLISRASALVYYLDGKAELLRSSSCF